MPKSLLRGNYRLLMAIESSSRADSWYRVLTDRTTSALSCDCPPWIFHQDGTGVRACQHTRIAALLAASRSQTSGTAAHPVEGEDYSFLIRATQQQWPGLRGQWEIESRDAPINQKAYRFFLLRLAFGNGGTATGVVAFCLRHPLSQARLEAGVAGWCGYAIAADVALRGGFPLAGQPPEHFRVSRRTQQRGAGATVQPHERTARQVPAIGLADILRIGDQLDLGDGLRPQQRAENTLRLFLGEQLYGQLEAQHFLDVSSVRYAPQRRVYRLRRDPAKRRERRVRVFEHGQYVHDFCIVRAQDVPEADHFLTIFLHLLSDEDSALSVVKDYNIFNPYSDGQEREAIAPVWFPRLAG